MSEGATTSSLAEIVLKRIDVGIFVLNKSFEVQLWNNFMAHHSGRPAEDMLGKNLFDTFPELPKPWFTKKVNTVIMLNNFALTHHGCMRRVTRYQAQIVGNQQHRCALVLCECGHYIHHFELA